jgi:hypothetical protein
MSSSSPFLNPNLTQPPMHHKSTDRAETVVRQRQMHHKSKQRKVRVSRFRLLAEASEPFPARKNRLRLGQACKFKCQ